MSIYTGSAVNRVNFGTSSQYTFTSAMTVCLWYLSDNITNESTIMSRYRSSAGNRSWLLENSTDFASRPAFLLYNTSDVGKAIDATTTVTQQSGWTHICATYNGSALNIYVNGSSDAIPVAQTGNIKVPGTDPGLCLGANFNSSGGGITPAQGQMFDVRLYNVALDANQIKAIYGARGKDTIFSGMVLRTGILDGPTGKSLGSTLIKDYSVYKNHIVATGEPTAYGDPFGVSNVILK